MKWKEWIASPAGKAVLWTEVEGKLDGNVYMTEKPKRIRNKALFRDDNASLSQGQDKRWYFYFSLDEDQ
ncbi:MAG: hypothetical protein II776_06310, partial [Clostridia bacterium]|nr:hypothetical protein [Clostridia bacterium]